MMRLAVLLSRPRFWSYLAGSYLVGWAFGNVPFSLIFLLHLVFFLFPANVFLYGVNDFFDRQTDVLNPKKRKEYVLQKSQRGKVYALVLVAFLMGLPLLVLQSSVDRLLFASWLFLSFFYSSQPLRFKRMPGFDLLSNVLYVLPGFLGYHEAGGGLPSFPIVLAVCCWAWAMHLFSAIPDIECDKKAGIRTTAVVLGKNMSLVLCMLLWLAFAGMIFHYYLGFIGLVYPLIPLINLIANLDTLHMYWWFSLINTVLGFVLFLVANGNI